jgi:hypothetical protein
MGRTYYCAECDHPMLSYPYHSGEDTLCSLVCAVRWLLKRVAKGEQA